MGSKVGLTISSKVSLKVGLLINGHGGGDDIPLLAGGLLLINLNNYYNITNNYNYDYISYKIDYKFSKRTFLRPWIAFSPKKRCVVRLLAPGDTSFGFDSTRMNRRNEVRHQVVVTFSGGGCLILST